MQQTEVNGTLPNIKQNLQIFQKLMRGLVKAFVHEADHVLFKAPPTTRFRLRALGLEGHTPKLGFLPSLGSEEAFRVTGAMLTLRPKFGIAQQKSHANGDLAVTPCRINLRQKPRWQVTQRTPLAKTG